MYFQRPQHFNILMCMCYNCEMPIFFFFFSYQDVHTQSFIMVVASHRWLGVRLDSLSALLTGVVALAALFVSQDAGKYNLIL